MTALSDWRTAFPIQPATGAVEALLQAWSELSRRPHNEFNPKTHEAALTKRLKVYVETYTSRERGLLGMWAAEDVIGEMDQSTGTLIQERRTDIVYGWNDRVQDLKLVFEFKRLGRQKTHRKQYLGSSGLERFVTGIYSRRQAVAVMVGVLLDPKAEVVPPICIDLGTSTIERRLRLRRTPSGEPFFQPSSLFQSADFDTEHERDSNLAPTHGTIRVSHFFFAFGYPTTTSKPKKEKAKQASQKAARKKKS